MESPQCVASQTEAVESRCRDIIRCIDSNDNTTKVTSGDVTDVWDKFKLWAGNIGARQVPNSASSLESRLKGARRVLEQVLRLLNDIREALDDLFEIVSGNQENRCISSAPKLANEDLKWGQSSGCNDAGGIEYEKYEDQDILELVSKSVGSLLKITVLIRKATPRDRFAKAMQGHNPFMDDFDIAYVAERYPKLAGPDTRWLCERLGRAITRRRQFLRYSRDHSLRISGNEDHQIPQYQMEHDGVHSGARTRSGTPSTASGMRTSYTSSYGAYTHASTKASTLDIAKLRGVEMMEAGNEETKSYVSAGSSFQMDKADSALHLPTLEEVSQGKEVFECPICFDIQTISRETSWRRHAFQDLKTYVCTGQGTCDSMFFGDSQSWLDHELKCHRQQWACILCQQSPFASKKGYEDHLTRKHGELIVGDDQLTAFASAGLRAVDAIPARDCPFCNEWADSMQSSLPISDSTSPGDIIATVDPKQYRRHVSQHLEQLALFALPRYRDGDNDNNTSEGANLSRSTINELEYLPFGDEREPDEEWIPDPPLHVAAARGDFEEVKRLIDDGADIHLRGETWGSVLDAALSYGGIYDPTLLELFRRELEDHQIDETSPTGGMRTEPSQPIPFPEKGKRRPLAQDFDGQSASVFPSPNMGDYPRISTSTVEKSFEYTKPSDWARYDANHDGPRSRAGRQETIDRGYYRSPSTVTSDEGRVEGGRGPPPPSSAIDMFDRAAAADIHNPLPATKPSPLVRDQRSHGQYNSRSDSKESGSRGQNVIFSSTVEYIDDHSPRSRSALCDTDKDTGRSDGPTSNGASTLQPLTDNDGGNTSNSAPSGIAQLRKTSEHLLHQPEPINLDDFLFEETQSPTEGESSLWQAQAARPRLKPFLKKTALNFSDHPRRMEKEVSNLKRPETTTIPPGARWTKINRKIVNPEALTIGKERFEERDDYVIVLRVLSKEEIQQYAEATARLREKRMREKLSYQPQCKICKAIEKNQQICVRLRRDIYRWQKEGNQHTTSEEAERDIKQLEIAIQQLEQQHYQKGHDIPSPLEVESAEV
ncbi:hypothetical protein PG985_010359 [Apiospora marii]|uniref:uncharacterized protein n=1 Tax=Apiospora marii TaxID=335849 RepID=UPI003130A73A